MSLARTTCCCNNFLPSAKMKVLASRTGSNEQYPFSVCKALKSSTTCEERMLQRLYWACDCNGFPSLPKRLLYHDRGRDSFTFYATKPLKSESKSWGGWYKGRLARTTCACNSFSPPVKPVILASHVEEVTNSVTNQ